MTTDALSVFPTVVLCVFVFVRKNGLRRISVGSPTSAALRGGLRLVFARAVPTVGVPSALSVRPPRSACAAPLPRMGTPLRTVAPGQSRRMSVSLRPMRLPSCVMKGMRVLPVKSCAARKVATGGATVDHQQGEPM